MNEFTHKFTRRKHGHDYRDPAIYHIILKKREGILAFGKLTGDPRIPPGKPGCAAINHTLLGKIINKGIYNLQYFCPHIQIYQYMTMPDHVHILLRVKERLPRVLGQYIGGLKTGVRTKWEEIKLKEGIAMRGNIFEDNFTDKIIHPGRNLDTVFRYIRENPHRLAVRKLYPEFFQRARMIKIKGNLYEAYGNLFHLRNPFKSQVIVHRVNSREKNERLQEEWLEDIFSGGVLVSPFISALEKKVYKDTIEAGGKIIHIKKDALSERYKPAEREFQLCREGRLLIIAPVESMGKALTRDICKNMNALAEAIVKEDFDIG